MMWREGKVPNLHLVALAALSLLVYAVAQKTVQRELRPGYSVKIEAAQTAQLAQHTIRTALEGLGRQVDLTNDPWDTGLIGEEQTAITSDRGFNTAKILATNPNAAAAFVDMFTRAGIKSGDRVAIGMTGSMPGWNIAVLSACHAMEISPVVITSVGASDWGANRPQLTWLDMERELRARDVLPYTSVAASLGGGGDRGRGLSPDGRRLLREAIDRNGVQLISAPTVERGIAERMRIYKKHEGADGYALYTNIGGGVASLGGRYNNQIIRAGYSRRLPPANYPVNAVINRMSRKGIPVVNLTDVDKISRRYGLLTIVGADPPKLGVGRLYYKECFNTTLTALMTVFLGIVVFSVIRLDLKRYVRRRPRSRATEEAV